MMMNTTAWIWAGFAAVVAAIVVYEAFTNNKRKRLPPGPKGLPILGHLHLLGKNPHQDMQKLSKTYGPMMYLRLGLVDNIIVSSPQAAERFLKTHDLNFASRPPNQAAKYIAYDQRDLAFGQYGPFWRNMRKLCTLELLSNLKINSFQSMRREELGLVVDSFKQAARQGEAVDLSSTISSMSMDMSCRMVFGKTYKNQDFGELGFKALIHEIVYLAAVPNLGDYFPYLGKLDVQGFTHRMKAVGKLTDQFMERIVEEHEEAATKGITSKTKDFVDTLLEIMKSSNTDFRFDRKHVKAMMLDILVTSMDTSSTVIEWTMSELFRHPEIMKKVRDEVAEKVGYDRMVEEADLEGLEYLEMVVKESLRLHPVVPLLLPHIAMDDCVVDGFHVPKNTRVMVNVWAIGRDPNVWSNPEKFIPERFSKSRVEYRGRNFELIPFGSGRRSCPGLQLGITVVQLVVAQLVHCFDWTLPNKMLPEDLDMTESFGLVISREKHLMAIPTYRLPQ
nr:cytochrome P450 CYP736A12-like [Ipomoea trifida]